MLRTLIALLLALMLALTSQSMAVARGAAAATGQMVLCTGAGPVAIYTDAQGQPTQAPHICPDAALNVVLAHAAPDGQIVLRFVLFEMRVPALRDTFFVHVMQSPPPRAPPMVV